MIYTVVLYRQIYIIFCDTANEWKKELEKEFPGMDVYMDPLSLSVACHIGPGALAVTVTRKLHF